MLIEMRKDFVFAILLINLALIILDLTSQ